MISFKYLGTTFVFIKQLKALSVHHFLSEMLLVFQRCHLKVLKILYYVFKIPSILKNKSSTCRETAPGC